MGEGRIGLEGYLRGLGLVDQGFKVGWAKELEVSLGTGGCACQKRHSHRFEKME